MRDANQTSYAASLKWLHWLIGLTVIGMLAGSFFLGDLPKAYRPTGYMLHKSTGILLMVLMLVRLFLVLKKGKPSLPASVTALERKLSGAVQLLFYVFLLLMPLSGWIMSVAANRIPTFYDLFPLPLPGIPQSKALGQFMNQSHKFIAWVLIALVVLHVLGALKHHFIDRDGVLRSMLPSK